VTRLSGGPPQNPQSGHWTQDRIYVSLVGRIGREPPTNNQHHHVSRTRLRKRGLIPCRTWRDTTYPGTVPVPLPAVCDQETYVTPRPTSRSVYNKISLSVLASTDISHVPQRCTIYLSRLSFSLPYLHFCHLNGLHHSSDISHQYVRFDMAPHLQFTAPFMYLCPRREQTHRLRLATCIGLPWGLSPGYRVSRPAAPFKGVYRFQFGAFRHHQCVYVWLVGCRQPILSHLCGFDPPVTSFQAVRPTARAEDVVVDVRTVCI